MRRLTTLTTALAMSSLFACVAPEGPEIALTDDGAALTAAGDDVLFTLTYSKGAVVYAAELLAVHVTVDGTVSAMPFTLEPPDGEVSEGDVLTVNEPGVDLLGPDDEGASFAVSLVVKDADELSHVEEIFAGSWEP
jgi:hypothetical protein